MSFNKQLFLWLLHSYYFNLADTRLASLKEDISSWLVVLNKDIIWLYDDIRKEILLWNINAFTLSDFDHNDQDDIVFIFFHYFSRNNEKYKNMEIWKELLNQDKILLNIVFKITPEKDYYKILKEIHFIDQYDFITNCSYFIYYSFFKYDYKKSIVYLNKLIEKYSYISQLYSLRVRSLFFLYYWRNKTLFNKTVINKGVDKIISNNVFQQIFTDIKVAKKINSDNTSIILFEIAIYLHLLMSKWEYMIKKYNNYFSGEYKKYLSFWLYSYYLKKGEYIKALNILNDMKSNNFKISKSKLYLYILLNDKEKFINEIEYLISSYWLKEYNIKKVNGKYIDQNWNDDIQLLDNYIFIPSFKHISYTNFEHILNAYKHEYRLGSFWFWETNYWIIFK